MLDRQRGAELKGGWDMDQQGTALTAAAEQLGLHDERARQILSDLWNSAFEQGRLEAMDELQARFCVCMK
jgi:hypothetical protein